MTNARDRASATAETAVALPALVLVLAVCVWALAVASAYLRCAEAARAGARVAARGEDAAAVSGAARGAAGRDVTVRTTSEGGLVAVRVTARVPVPVPVLRGLVPPVTVGETATAAAEPGAVP